MPEPFFNEPGFEVYLGTETGESRSKSYNKEVIKNTIKFAMLEQIQHPPPEFKEVIHTHFALKGKYILQVELFFIIFFFYIININFIFIFFILGNKRIFRKK